VSDVVPVFNILPFCVSCENGLSHSSERNTGKTFLNLNINILKLKKTASFKVEKRGYN